ncbi:MAG: HEAT repeat domain-containing protein, partial [Planctomycetota bacterium]
ISRIGLSDGSDVKNLHKTINDNDPDIRSRSIDALSTSKKLALSSIDKIIIATYDNNKRVRISAVKAIGKIGNEASSAVDRLILIITSDSEENDVKIESIDSLGYIGNGAKDALPILEGIILENDTGLFINAKDAVRKIKK